MKNFAVVNTVNKTGWGTPSIEFFDTVEEAEKRTGYFGRVVKVLAQSKTKTMTLEEAKEQGYSFPVSHFSVSDSFYSEENDTVYINASKLVLKDGVTEKDVKARIDYMWENSISGDVREFYNRID